MSDWKLDLEKMLSNYKQGRDLEVAKLEKYKDKAQKTLEGPILAALKNLEGQLSINQRIVEIETGDFNIRLVVYFEGEVEFTYQIFALFLSDGIVYRTNYQDKLDKHKWLQNKETSEFEEDFLYRNFQNEYKDALQKRAKSFWMKANEV